MLQTFDEFKELGKKSKSIQDRKIQKDNLSGLGILRSAMSLFYGDTFGKMPMSIEEIMDSDRFSDLEYRDKSWFLW